MSPITTVAHSAIPSSPLPFGFGGEGVPAMLALQALLAVIVVAVCLRMILGSGGREPSTAQRSDRSRPARRAVSPVLRIRPEEPRQAA